MELDPCTPFIDTQAAEDFNESGLYILGIPFDGTTSFRPGSRLGPNAIREASVGIESYSPYMNKETTDYNIYDLGNLPFTPSKPEKTQKFFFEATSNFNPKIHKLITLGGEHSISYAPIKLHLDHYPDLVLIHMDAHADLRDGYLDEPFSHASIIRRVVDHFNENNELIQYGIRSGTKEEFIWMRENKTIMNSQSEFIEKVKCIDPKRPIYLTLDLDYFDPAYLPGTGTPESGGEDFHSLIKLLKILSTKNFIGADIVELAPQLDSSNNSSVMAAKTTREIMLSLLR